MTNTKKISFEHLESISGTYEPGEAVAEVRGLDLEELLVQYDIEEIIEAVDLGEFIKACDPEDVKEILEEMKNV